MLALALALALAPDAAAPTAAVADEITVIGKRLQGWRGVIRTKDGAARCSTRRSSGDAKIDAIGCDAMLTCWPQFEPEFRTVVVDKTDRATRDRRNAEVGQRMAACVQGRNDALIAALAAARAGADPG